MVDVIKQIQNRERELCEEQIKLKYEQRIKTKNKRLVSLEFKNIKLEKEIEKLKKIIEDFAKENLKLIEELKVLEKYMIR